MGCPSPQEPEEGKKAWRSIRGQRDGAGAFLSPSHTRKCLSTSCKGSHCWDPAAEGPIAETRRRGTEVGKRREREEASRLCGTGPLAFTSTTAAASSAGHACRR